MHLREAYDARFSSKFRALTPFKESKTTTYIDRAAQPANKNGFVPVEQSWCGIRAPPAYR